MTPGVSAVAEGAILDDAGNLITTTYVDLRDANQQDPIPALVKACRREHALEDGDTVRISKPTRFREFGEGLIQDDHEGFALEQSMTDTTNLSPADATRQRALADQNEAYELVNPSGALKRTETRQSSETTSNSLRYGKEWWIFSTSIEPDAGGCDTWQESLAPEYDHVSVIGQPAKFAQSLARMVAEQIGPQGNDGTLQQTINGIESATTQIPLQQVIHGPVVYSDRPYQDLVDDDGGSDVLALIFTKRAEYAAQREYRFAIFCQDNDAETVDLRISGMMRDSLERSESGLIRNPPPPVQAATVALETEPLDKVSTPPKPTVLQTKTTERHTRKEERRSQVRRPDGHVESLQEERHEQIVENTVMENRQGAEEGPPRPLPDRGTGSAAPPRDDKVNDTWKSDEAIVCELTGTPFSDEVKTSADPEASDQQDHGTGQVSEPMDDFLASLRDMAQDPATPWAISQTSLQESVLKPEDVLKTFGAVDVLSIKMGLSPVEFQQAIASAGWYAMHCIRNLTAQFGDIVKNLAIERGRFVVIRLTDSGETGATGRIAIAPSGAYAYCLQRERETVSGSSEGGLGTMLFPIGKVGERLENFGWPTKADHERRGQA